MKTLMYTKCLYFRHPFLIRRFGVKSDSLISYLLSNKSICFCASFLLGFFVYIIWFNASESTEIARGTKMVVPIQKWGDFYQFNTELFSTEDFTESFETENETQQTRLDRLQRACDKYHGGNVPFKFWRKKSNKLRVRKKKIDRYCTTKQCPFIVNEKRHVMLCFIQKVASTSVKEMFLKATKVSEIDNVINSNNTKFHIDANKLLFRVSPFYFSNKVLDQYFKAIFVRHPFERLVSAFKDKGEKPRELEPYFYVQYWDRIMNKTRNGTVDKNSVPTFKEFIKLLVSTSPAFYDEHWAPFWTRCELCYIQYDFIGKLETPEDFEYLSQKLGNNRTFTWKNKSNLSTSKVTKRYFSQIPQKDILKLYRKYYLDFKMFGYSLEGYV